MNSNSLLFSYENGDIATLENLQLHENRLSNRFRWFRIYAPTGIAPFILEYGSQMDLSHSEVDILPIFRSHKIPFPLNQLDKEMPDIHQDVFHFRFTHPHRFSAIWAFCLRHHMRPIHPSENSYHVIYLLEEGKEYIAPRDRFLAHVEEFVDVPNAQEEEEVVAFSSVEREEEVLDAHEIEREEEVIVALSPRVEREEEVIALSSEVVGEEEEMNAAPAGQASHRTRIVIGGVWQDREVHESDEDSPLFTPGKRQKYLLYQDSKKIHKLAKTKPVPKYCYKFFQQIKNDMEKHQRLIKESVEFLTSKYPESDLKSKQQIHKSANVYISDLEILELNILSQKGTLY